MRKNLVSLLLLLTCTGYSVEAGLPDRESISSFTPYSDSSGLKYFTGEWDFKIWFSGNNSDAPDISATWTLTPALGNKDCYTGGVEIAGDTFTRELMVFDSYEKLYVRTVMTISGAVVVLRSIGWQGKNLIWQGYQDVDGKRTELKEEIEKISATYFKATFYTLADGSWQQTQTEHLSRVK